MEFAVAGASEASRCLEWFHIMEATRSPCFIPSFVSELGSRRARDGLVRLLRNDFDARKDSSGPLKDGGQRQRKIHHGTAHKILRLGRSLAHPTIKQDQPCAAYMLEGIDKPRPFFVKLPLSRAGSLWVEAT